jgi:outer membrane receptor protein involved in Fe transport
MSGRAVPDEMAFVDRIEDSRGANSILFGIGQPGGVLNTSTKKANASRGFQKVSATYGSYDSKRATLDVNQPLLAGKLGVRLNLVYNDTHEFRYFQHETHQRALLSATYTLTDRTRVRAEFERGQLETNRPTGFDLTGQAIPWINAGRPTFATQTANAAAGTTRLNANNSRVTYIANDGLTLDMRGTVVANAGAGNVITDRSLSDPSVNFGGPAQNRFTRFGVFSAYLEHQLAKDTYLEFGFNHSDQSFDNRDPRVNSNALLGDPNQRLNAATLNGGPPNPYAGQLYLESNWFRTVRWDQSDTGRASVVHALNGGRWGDYRFAGVVEYEKQFLLSRSFREVWYDAATAAFGPFNPVPDNAANNVIRRTYVTERNWSTYHVDGPVGSGGLLENVMDPVSGRLLSSAWVRQGAPNESYTTQKSGMFVTQAKYFNGRLIVGGGLRRDEFDSKRLATGRNGQTQFFEVIRDTVASTNSAIGRTKTFGAVYHVPLPEQWRTVGLSLYYNWSNNVSIPSAGAFMLDPSGDPLLEPVPLPKPEGRSEDYSLGLSLLEGRVYMKGTYYRTESRDQSATSPAAVRSDNTAILDALLAAQLISQAEHDTRDDVGGQGLFGQRSTGTEFQIIGNPTRNWRLQVNYSDSKPVDDYRFSEWLKWEQINNQFLSQLATRAGYPAATIAPLVADIRDQLAAQTRAVGLGKLGNRRHKVSLFTRYDLSSGWFKGAYFGGGYRHQSKMFTGPNLATGEILYGNSYWRADALLGYAVQGLKGRKLTFQLNVFNVFNERDPLVIRYATNDPSTVFRHVVQPPTTWRLTMNLEF